MSLRDEILEQPAVAQRMLDHGREAIGRIAAAAADREVDLVCIAARGTSDHAAIYAQYVFGAHLRLPVALATPSLTSLYGVTPRLERALVIAISQSGRSPDVVGTLAAAREQGAPTIAITNDPGSDLASTAEHVIHLDAGPELAVAATKTYTAELLAIALLATALEGRLGTPTAAGHADELDEVPEAIAHALSSEQEAEAAARGLAERDRCIVVGRGFEYATARELALKLKELARVAADPYSAADFLHGPLALVEPGYPVIAVAPSGAAAEDVDAVISQLRELGVDVVVLSDRPAALATGSPGVTLPSNVPEWLRPITTIVTGQFLALHLAHARGINPESPRWITKVTLTR